jgi:hypothetical protein
VHYWRVKRLKEAGLTDLPEFRKLKSISLPVPDSVFRQHR